MNIGKLIEWTSYTVGGVALFTASFLVFGLAAGVPANELAVVGGLFPAPPTAPADPRSAAERSADSGPADLEDLIAATASRIGAGAMPSPWDPGELEGLTADLQRRRLTYEQRLDELDVREGALDERELRLDDQAEMLQALKDGLDLERTELDLRQAELARDEQAAEDAAGEVWKRRAGLFASGDASELVKKLMAYGPEDAARILTELGDKKANEYLLEIPDGEFQDYLDAYSALP